jgi:branched-chain amino acid transport system permease protein
MVEPRLPISRLLIIELAALIALLLLGTLSGGYEQTIVTKLVLLSLLAISFDLCWGYSGIMAFGQALFFGSAGYVVALLNLHWSVHDFFLVAFAGGLTGAVGSALVGWFLLLTRRKVEIIFVSLGTLSTSYIAERLAGGWQAIGAANGLSISDPLTVGSYEMYSGPAFFYTAVALLLAIYCLSRWLVRSQFGLVLSGIRQNEERLAFFGYRIQVFKAIVFIFAGAIAGLAGALFSFHESYIGPNNIGFLQSTYAGLYALFGGPGTLLGPVLGVFAIEGLGFALSDIDVIRGIWPAIMGVLMLVVVVYRPTGLMGLMLNGRKSGPSRFARELPFDQDQSSKPQEVADVSARG